MSYEQPGAVDPYGYGSYGAYPGYTAPAWNYAAYAPPQPSGPVPGADEVRTVFITGFPQDVKERELNNMLRFLPGYEASQMHFRNNQAQGFALFVTGALARSAVDAIQNLVFDNDCVLRAEMAHKNMYLKDDPVAATKRSRPSYEGSGGGGAYGGYPGAGGAPGAYGGGYPGAPAPGGVPPMQPRGYAPISNTKDNPPCNTLFIGNLGDSVSEAELRGLFSHQPGFQQLKLVRGPKGVSCFIEYSDVPSAMAVHDAQQGAILASSDRGGIRIQYSKNPFGRKRDAAGQFVDAAPPVAMLGGGAVGGSGSYPGSAASAAAAAAAAAATAAGTGGTLAAGGAAGSGLPTDPPTGFVDAGASTYGAAQPAGAPAAATGNAQ